MKIEFVDLHKQYLTIKKDIDQAIQKVIEETSFIRGKYVDEFEKDFATALGAKYSIGVGNGTDAITIILKGLGIGAGDEVITVANSFIATSEAITAAGAKVVFVDCDPITYNIDTSKIEAKITSKTKAIIPVHLYGLPANMEEVMKIAAKHKLFVVEDCAQAHFSEFTFSDGTSRKIGTIGNASSFSFYPGKNLGAYGDAGGIVTSDEALYKKMKMYANHGRISKYDHEFEGINSRMDGMQGAVLGVKLKHLDSWCNLRAKHAKYYCEQLKDVSGIILPSTPKNCKHVFHLFVIRTEKRDELMNFLQAEGISVGVHYPITLPNLLAYKYLGHTQSDFPVANEYQAKILSLPIYPEIEKAELDYVISKVKEFFKK